MRVLRGLIEIENEDTPDPALEWSDWEFWMDVGEL